MTERSENREQRQKRLPIRLEQELKPNDGAESEVVAAESGIMADNAHIFLENGKTTKGDLLIASRSTVSPTPRMLDGESRHRPFLLDAELHEGAPPIQSWRRRLSARVAEVCPTPRGGTQSQRG